MELCIVLFAATLCLTWLLSNLVSFHWGVLAMAIYIITSHNSFLISESMRAEQNQNGMY